MKNTNEINKLNLARKWRPQTFKDIIGQTIATKTLQNSLYINKLFPVYLFAGQRGCGKTSTARIFGAALNCQNLEKFQQNPTFNIPCLECDSCKAMLAGNHPDFIEIDAASHTGVDNVRQILEASSYMPLSGRKKIYLIDEAHMLSKAAFNAFLKMLEEPPATTLFILATTEKHKIPETVLSRCFQIIFPPLKKSDICNQLKQICKEEKINIEEEGLQVIAEESGGSVRDAINLLEQIRFSGEFISKDKVLQILGKISDAILIKIINAILRQNSSELLDIMKEIEKQPFNPQTFWNMLVKAIRNIVWLKYDVSPEIYNMEEFKKLANIATTTRLHAMLQLLWSQEPLFLQTTNKIFFLETVLLQLCNQINIEEIQKIMELFEQQFNEKNEYHSPITIQQKLISDNNSYHNETLITNKTSPNNNLTTSTPTTNHEIDTTKNKHLTTWNNFLKLLETEESDPLLTSIFKQTKFININEQTKTITVEISDNRFFIEKLKETENNWKKLLMKNFPQIDDVQFKKVQLNSKNSTPPPQKAQNIPFFKKTTITKKFIVDLTNKEKWPKANLLLQYFPGKIREIQ